MSGRFRGIILAIVGLGLIAIGIVAVYLLFQQIGSQTQVAQPTAVPVVKTTVVIVTHDIFLGEVLGLDDVTEIEVPVELVPRDAFTDMTEVVDKYSKVDLVQGEMVLAHNLADPTNVNHDLAFILAKDHVLMAFPAIDLISRESVVQRGDIVDVFVTLSQEVKPLDEQGGTTGEEEAVTEMFTFDAMQKLGITAIVMDVIREQTDEEGAPVEVTVTEPPTRSEIRIRAYLLALDPQDALLLKYLMDRGAIFDLVIRNPNSDEDFVLTPITQEYIVELYGLEILP